MVEGVIGEMRVSLGALLKDPLRPIEEQERIIECVACTSSSGWVPEG